MGSSHAAATVWPATRPLWRDRSFTTFWVAQTLSVAGDSFAAIAVPLLVLDLTGSVEQMGLLTGATGAISVIAGLFAGVLVDRVDRRVLMIACDIARMVLYGLIPLAWVFGPRIWLLFVVLPISGAIGMVFQIASVSVVRSLVAGDRMTEANGRLYATYAAAGVGGPLLAGLVSASFGPTAAISINAVSFGLSAIGLYFVRLRRASTQLDAPAAGAKTEGPLAEFLAGARFLWGHPVLRTLTILLSIFIFLAAGLTDVLIYHIKHDLGGSDGTVGTVLGVAALGTIAGALLVAPLRRRVGFSASWIGAHAMCGLSIATIGVASSVPTVAVVAAGYLCASSVSGICSMSLRQEVTPNHLLGRVTSAFWSTHFSLGPLGAGVLTWGAGRFGVKAVCFIAGAGCLLIAAVVPFTPIRHLRPEATVRLQLRTAARRTTERRTAARRAAALAADSRVDH